jgi:hypothetical protein
MATVNVMFNGPGYAPDWLLLKAEMELPIAMAHGGQFMERAANLSVSIAHLADWVLAFKTPAFAHCKNLGEVIDEVKRLCPKCALFFDICNEYKHADRTKASVITAQVMVYADSFPASMDLSNFADGNRIINPTSDWANNWVFKPVIKDHAGNELPFRECAQDALSWWRSKNL